LVSLTLREEHRLRLFENRMLRRLFGPKREEVTGGWRRLHNEELQNLYVLQMLLGGIRWARHLARMGDIRNSCTVLVGQLKEGDHL
jgi:hypothetical protein